MAMAYVDERGPPEEAWGKKFNALPLLKKSGSMISYHDAVSQMIAFLDPHSPEAGSSHKRRL
jgi:hypothetical protein